MAPRSMSLPRALATTALSVVVLVTGVVGGQAVLRDGGPSQVDPPTTSLRPPSTVPEPPPGPPSALRLRMPAAPPDDPNAPEPEVVVGRIEIPKLGLDVALGQGISLTSIDRGPSHWPGTALPGEPGNVVVAGHRVTNSRPFRDIDQLVTGDEVALDGPHGRFVYRVTGTSVVTPDAMDIVRQTPEPTATLFACHPPGSARYRYVVRLALDGAPVVPPELLGLQ